MKLTSLKRFLSFLLRGLLRFTMLLNFHGHLCVVALLASADEDSHGATNDRALVSLCAVAVLATVDEDSHGATNRRALVRDWR